MNTSLPPNQPNWIGSLKLFKRTLSPWELQPLLSDIDEGMTVWSSGDSSNAYLFISKVVHHLRSHPNLLFRFNDFIYPQFRLEYPTSSQEIRHFVIVNEETGHARIFSTTPTPPRYPSSQKEVYEHIHSKAWWSELLCSQPDTDWLECVAQIVEEIAKSSTNDDLLAAQECLRLLAKAGIIPPSFFLRSATAGVQREQDSNPGMEYVTFGGNCDVHRASVNGQLMCFRVLRQSEKSDIVKLKMDFCRELVTWRQLDHPNVIPLFGASWDAFPGRFCFVLPWMSHGSIITFLEDHPHHDRFLAICQIADGINYLHSRDPPVIHKDIKGANILVRPDHVCVLTDFGLSSVMDSQRSPTSGRGSLYWMAPELIDSTSENVSLDKDVRPRDVYSFGSTMAEIMGADIKTMWLSVIRNETPSIQFLRRPYITEEQDLLCFIRQCIQVDPLKRPSIRVLCQGLEDVRRVLQSPPLPSIISPPRPTPDIKIIQKWIHQQSLLLSLETRSLQRRGLFTPTTPTHPLVNDLESADELPTPTTILRPHSQSLLRPLLRFRATSSSAANFPTPPDTPVPPSPRILTSNVHPIRRTPLSPLSLQTDHRLFATQPDVSRRPASPLRHALWIAPITRETEAGARHLPSLAASQATHPREISYDRCYESQVDYTSN